MRAGAILLVLSLFGCDAIDDEGEVFDDEDEVFDDEGEDLPTTATTVQFKAISHNIAGGAMNRGSGRVLTLLFQQVDYFKPDVVMLQEVCASQSDAFRARYPTWSLKFYPMRNVEANCGGRPAGQLLASRWKMNTVTVTPLGDPDATDGRGAKWFTLLCADLQLPGRGVHAVRACVTHLRAFQDATAQAARARQIVRVRYALHARIWTQGQAVVLGGDFNVLPHNHMMSPLYRLTQAGSLSGPGSFYEADQDDTRYFQNTRAVCDGQCPCAGSACRSGQYTINQLKYDYVFFSRNRSSSNVSALAVDNVYSDHHLYRAQASMVF